jgi:Glycosyltransferase family 87
MTRPTIRRALAGAVAALALIGAPAAQAQEAETAEPLQIIANGPEAKPPGFHVTAGEAAATAARVPEVREELAKGGLERLVAVPGYTGDPHRWQVTYSRDGTGVVEVHVDGIDGHVLEVWTGPQVDFLLARPWAEKTGGPLNQAWIWIPLCLLFLAPFFDPKRPFRLIHLDLVVLLSFGVAQLLFNEGKLDVWVPAVYPVLIYLLVRLLLAGFKPRERRERLIPVARDSWLLVGLVLLLIGRLVLNVVDSEVIDVGYSSVVGADNLVHGGEISGYGPLMFLAYVPFELVFPWHGSWDAVPAAHAAALTFDLLTVVGLVLLGRSLRAGREGRTLGLALAFAWVAFPYSTYVLQSNTNDGLVAMLLVYTMLALRTPAGSGLMLGLATAAKFFPAALAPLFAAGTGDRRPRSLLRFAGTFAAVCLVAVYVVLPDGGIGELWRDTIGYQLGRESPFSMWGLHPSLEPLQLLLEAATAAMCVAFAWVPRRRDARQVAALAAAAVIALQLCATYWLFFYVAWFAPLALVAIFAAYRDPLPEPEWEFSSSREVGVKAFH